MRGMFVKRNLVRVYFLLYYMIFVCHFGLVFLICDNMCVWGGIFFLFFQISKKTYFFSITLHGHSTIFINQIMVTL
jgi:hypothetical protein